MYIKEWGDKHIKNKWTQSTNLGYKKHFECGGAFDLGGLLTAYGISSEGAFDRGDQNQGGF